MQLSRAVAAVLVVIAAGCATVTTSKLEKGDRVEIGRRPFDAYFAEVATLRDDVAKIDADLFPIREPLVEQLDLGVDAPIGTLMAATSKRVTKIRDFGIMLSLRLTPTPRVVMMKGDVAIDERDQPLFDAIEKSATIGLEEFRKQTELLERAAELEARRGQLAEQLAKLSPRAEDKRGEIEAEILGAGRVLRKAEQSLLRNARTISHFLVALSNAVDTGATEMLETSCEDAVAKALAEERSKKPTAPPYGKGPVRPGPKPAGPRPRPPAPKPPPPPPGGDFEM